MTPLERPSLWPWLLFGLLLYLTYLIFAPFLVPLGWACVLAVCFYPVHGWMYGRLGRANLAALLSVLLVTLVIVLPAVLVAENFTTQAVEAVRDLQQRVRAGQLPAWERLTERLPMQTLRDWAQQRLGLDPTETQELAVKQFERVAGFLAGKLTALVRNVLLFVGQLLMVLFATFYLFRDGPGALERLRRVLPLGAAQRDRLLLTAQEVLYTSVYSSFLIAILQGLLGGLLFWAVGIGKPVFWGVIMGFLSLLPVVGAWLVWLPAAAALLLEGETARGLVVLAAGALVVGTVDNVLRPWLMSGRLRLNGLLVFISVLGGLVAFGSIGLVLGPMIVAIGVAILEAYTVPAAAPAPAEGA